MTVLVKGLGVKIHNLNRFSNGILSKDVLTETNAHHTTVNFNILFIKKEKLSIAS